MERSGGGDPARGRGDGAADVRAGGAAGHAEGPAPRPGGRQAAGGPAGWLISPLPRPGTRTISISIRTQCCEQRLLPPEVSQLATGSALLRWSCCDHAVPQCADLSILECWQLRALQQSS